MKLVQYSNFDYIFVNDPDKMCGLFGITFERMQELENEFNAALRAYMDPEGEKNVEGVAKAFNSIATNESEKAFAIFRAGCVDGVFCSQAMDVDTEAEGGDDNE